MNKQNKTLYLWDLAGTLFHENWDNWNIKLTGFKNYKKWLENKTGKSLAEISDWDYEHIQKTIMINGKYINLDIQPGFKQVLSWTKNNETFSTGNTEQMDWRAKYLNPKVGFNIKKYFQKINSTFDYGKTNKKTAAMLADYLNKKYKQGFATIVYSDDKIENLKSFEIASKKIKKKYSNFNWRLYHILNNKSGLKKKKEYFEIGSLLDLLKNEKQVKKDI